MHRCRSSMAGTTSWKRPSLETLLWSKHGRLTGLETLFSGNCWNDNISTDVFNSTNATIYFLKDSASSCPRAYETSLNDLGRVCTTISTYGVMRQEQKSHLGKVVENIFFFLKCSSQTGFTWTLTLPSEQLLGVIWTDSNQYNLSLLVLVLTYNEYKITIIFLSTFTFRTRIWLLIIADLALQLNNVL